MKLRIGDCTAPLDFDFEKDMTDVSELRCPKCGSYEDHPNGKWILIRANKVYDDKGTWSQCLVCAGYYDKDLNPIDELARPTGGWFKS